VAGKGWAERLLMKGGKIRRPENRPRRESIIERAQDKRGSALTRNSMVTSRQREEAQPREIRRLLLPKLGHLPQWRRGLPDPGHQARLLH
jgi:hypothetical protein